MGDGERTTPLPSPVRILLLEDSDIDAELLAGHLAAAGLVTQITRVHEREPFKDGLCDSFDLILADYALPAFDGMTALDLAREQCPEVPFIFVSGVVGEEFATGALKRGATDYVMKRNLSRLPAAVTRALAEAHERAERRRAEAALRASELSCRVALEAARLGLWEYLLPAGEVRADERCKALLGVPQDREVEPGTLRLVCHPHDLAGVLERITAATDPRGSGLFDAEFRVLLPSGGARWVATRGQALFEQGTCTKLIGILRDVSEAKRSEDEMRGRNETLARRVEEQTRERDRIWNVSQDLLGVASPDGTWLSVNPAWDRVLGWDEADLIGQPPDHLEHEADRGRTRAEFAELAAGAPPRRFEARYRCREQGYRWLSWTAVLDGERIYTVARDITDEKNAADWLAATNDALRQQIDERERMEATLRQMQRLEAVGQLTAGVAHDFNNLLTVVLGNIAFLERTLAHTSGDGALARRLGQMRLAAERGAKLTEQLLAFSRRQRLEPKPVDLNEVVLNMRDLLSSTMGGAIRLEMELGPELWPALIDPTQIELVILNLAINARDAMEVGGTLRVATRNVIVTEPPQRPEEPAPGEYVVITVTDNGTGMPPDVLAKAFEPFFTTKEIGKGSGLGLAQVYGFAKQSGGGVSLETRVGHGTTVRVFLPRALEFPARAERHDRHDIAPTVTPERRLVLVVDDDLAVREVTATMLRDLGYAVTEAGSGAEALELLMRRGAEIDLLLVDFAMPGMNGAQLAQAARARWPKLPVLFVTGYAEQGALGGANEDSVLRKPFAWPELAGKVGAVLRRTRHAPPREGSEARPRTFGREPAQASGR